MTKKIVLIDDDRSLHLLLGKYLEQQNYQVSHAYDGQEGLQILHQEHGDLVVLDVMMPRLDGWKTLEHIREVSDIPVILLTARDTEMDKLQGFHLGSDDYITKPFSFAELTARIDAVLRRATHQYNTTDKILSIGDLVLDPTQHIVRLKDQLIELTPSEFKLLEVMMREPGRIFTKEQLVTRVWGDEYATETGYIRRYIWHLRSKIEPDPNAPQYIHTEHGVGYKVEDRQKKNERP